MKAPEKIYLQEPTKVRTQKMYDNDVEYTRTDALIEKAEKFLNNKFCDVVNVRVSDTLTELTTRQDFIERFRKYMEGEKS